MNILKNNVLGTVFVSFWSVFLLFFGISCIARPKYSVTFTYPDHKIDGAALDQAAMYTVGVGLLCVLIGCYGLYAMKTRQDLKSAILIFCVMTFGGSLGDMYQLYYNKHFGSSRIFALSSINFQLVSFIGGVFAYFTLPKVTERRGVSPLVKYFFWISAIYIGLSSIPGIFYPVGSVSAQYSFTSKDSRQISQVSLFAWLYYFYLSITSLIAFSGQYTASPELVVGLVVNYVLGIVLSLASLMKRKQLHTNFSFPISVIAINSCLAIFGLIILRELLPLPGYTKIEHKTTEQGKTQQLSQDQPEQPPVKAYGGEKIPEQRTAVHRNLQHRAADQVK